MADHARPTRGLTIRAFETRDEEPFAAFQRSEAAVDAYGFAMPPRSIDDVRRHVERIRTDPTAMLWTVACPDDAALGFFLLYSIDEVNRTLCLGMGIYGADRRGSSLGTASRRMALDMVFNELNFRRVYGLYMDTNVASRRMNERLGARVTGRRRAVCFVRGELRDAVTHTTTREDFNALLTDGRRPRLDAHPLGEPAPGTVEAAQEACDVGRSHHDLANPSGSPGAAVR